MGQVEEQPLTQTEVDELNNLTDEQKTEIVAEASKPPEVNPVEEAAVNFTKLLPYVKKFCAVMPTKGQARVHHALAEFPLGATKPRLLNDAERQLFHILQQLNGYKSTIIQDILKKQMNQTPVEIPTGEKEVTNESSTTQA